MLGAQEAVASIIHGEILSVVRPVSAAYVECGLREMRGRCDMTMQLNAAD